MRMLTILRHAKSSWDDSSLADFDRPLNERGTKSARRMGREMKLRDMRFDQVLASPAMRVRETLKDVAVGYGSRFDVAFDDRIYMASAGTLIEIIRAIPDEAHAPLVVGHNPGVAQTLSRLSRSDDQGFRDRVLCKFPTGALAVVKLPAKRWRDIEEESGEIVELILPRELS